MHHVHAASCMDVLIMLCPCGPNYLHCPSVCFAVHIFGSEVAHKPAQRGSEVMAVQDQLH